MSQVTTIIILGSLSLAGLGVSASLPPSQATGTLDWKDIAGGSSAVLMFAALIVVLRYITEQGKLAAEEAKARADRAIEEAKAQAAERAAVASERMRLAETFSETAVGLTTQFREDVAKGRQEMHELVKELKTNLTCPSKP